MEIWFDLMKGFLSDLVVLIANHHCTKLPIMALGPSLSLSAAIIHTLQGLDMAASSDINKPLQLVCLWRAGGKQ